MPRLTLPTHLYSTRSDVYILPMTSSRTLHDYAIPYCIIPHLRNRCDWIKTKVVQIDPDVNTIKTEDGQNLKYKYLIVALGIKLNYEKV